MLRIATHNDSNALARLLIASHKAAYDALIDNIFFDESVYQLILSRFEERLKNPKIFTWLKEEAGIPVGFIILKISDTPEISHLYVQPDHWGKGIGTILCTTVFNCLKNKQIPNVETWVVKDNNNAFGFYKKLGFEPTQRSKQLQYVNKQLIETQQWVKNLK